MSYFDWPPEDQDLAAGIIGMLTGIRLCRKHGYDPVEVCKHLSDDDIIERIIGRRLYDDLPPLTPANDYQI
jgi:hypothetical protein